MSDDFTLQGGVGTPSNVEAEMVQGLGFPLRSIIPPAGGNGSTIVEVNTVDDLPEPALVPSLGYTARTLEVNTVYHWNAQIDVGTTPFYVPSAGAALSSRGINIKGARFTSSIIYSGTQPLFHAEGELALEFMNVTSPNAYVVNWNSADANQSLIFQNGLYYACKGLATITGELVTCSLRLVTAVSITDDFLVITGADPRQLNVTGGLFTTFDGKLFDISGASELESVIITSDNRFSGNAGSTILHASANNANLAEDGYGIVSGNVFNGDGNNLGGGITEQDTRWDFIDNQGDVATSHEVASANANKAAGPYTTTNPSDNSYVPLTATFIEDSETARFTVATNGEITYTGVKNVGVRLNAIAGVRRASGSGALEVDVRWAKSTDSGTSWNAIDDNTVGVVDIDARLKQVVTAVTDMVAPNDMYRLEVANVDSTSVDLSTVTCELFIQS